MVRGPSPEQAAMTSTRRIRSSARLRAIRWICRKADCPWVLVVASEKLTGAVVTMVRGWAQLFTITAAEALGRQAKARSRRVVSSASRSTNSAAFVARASAADCPDVRAVHSPLAKPGDAARSLASAPAPHTEPAETARVGHGGGQPRGCRHVSFRVRTNDNRVCAPPRKNSVNHSTGFTIIYEPFQGKASLSSMVNCN
jgi:hypothetical protein